MKTSRNTRAGVRQRTSVAIVGSGFGGLAAAIELKRNGFTDIVVFERAGSVGGVWRDNSYPGAACDVPSSIYSYSYALKADWSSLFGKQAEIQTYLENVSDRFGITEHIRFDTEVTDAEFNDEAGTWVVSTATGDSITVDLLIMATGQLSRPKLPDVPGLDSFGGRSFHSALWEHDAELDGKKVVVVGSGASAVQIVPAIADVAADLTVVQRSPNWVMWKSRRRPGALQTALMNYVGPLRRLHHNLMFLAYESRFPLVTRAANPVRRLSQWWLIRNIKKNLTDPAEVKAAIPRYRLMCNRLLLSNDWYPTLGREDVHLVGSAVERVDETGVVTADGRHIEADVLVWCTGFKASEFLSPIAISGRGGVDLHAQWSEGAEAYLGMTAPNFPNLFMLFGPNTNSITNTIVFLLERQASYIRQALEYKEQKNLAWLEVSQSTHLQFQRWLDSKLKKTVFTDNCPGWYTNANGKVTAMWPASHLAYAKATRHFDPQRYASKPISGPTQGDTVSVADSSKSEAVSRADTVTGTAPAGQIRPDSIANAGNLCVLFDRTVTAHPDSPALHSTSGELNLSYREYRDGVEDIAGALYRLGIRRGDTVALMFDNRPEFHVIDTAVMHLGATTCSIYNTSPAGDIEHVLTNSVATLAICEKKYAPTLAEAAGKLGIETVCIDPAVSGTTHLDELPRPTSAEFDFEATWNAVDADDVLTLIYTSGTTGVPKGVELTHRAMLAEIAATAELVDFRAGDRVPSALPMAHAAQRWGTLYSAFAFGLDVTCVDDVAALGASLPEIRPQIWGTVPRILEKITAGLRAKFEAESDPQTKAGVDWALDIAQQVIAARRAANHGEGAGPGDELLAEYQKADDLVLSKIRAALGLDELRWLVVGAAPTPPHVLDFISALGFEVIEVWGMSELGAVATMNPLGAQRLGTVGVPLRGVEVRLADDAEIMVRGPIMMRGYRGNAEQTAAAIDTDGWLATGDIGALDEDGYLSVVDRKKELIVNAAGKNISPLRIEAAVKAETPLIGSVVAIGDGRPFISALVVLDPETALAFAESAGLTASTLEEIAADPAVTEIVAAAVFEANEKLSRVEQIKKYSIVADVWLPGGQELTPTLKLRRKPIAEKYGTQIEELYSATGASR